jgi:tetratricopeptide (TPR) repeat protein
MLLPLLLLAQTAPAAAPAAGPPTPARSNRYAECVDQARRDPGAAERGAKAWQQAGGGFLAQQCLGIAYTTQQRWDAAAAAFEGAARTAEAGKDQRSGSFWAQAGNAWLAFGDAAKAQAALDAALIGGTLNGLDLGEAHLDRARALVAAGRPNDARADLDRALALAGDDPLAWLLSATLARRTGDLLRARKDIGRALALSSDDASVQLEAGNIAAVEGNEAAARSAWETAMRVAPGSAQAQSASDALAGLGRVQAR